MRLLTYDPLGHREWRASQAAAEFQKAAHHAAEETGREHPLADTKVQCAPAPKPANPNAGVVQAFPKGRW